MAIKDILVHLDGTPRSGVRLEIAAALARAHGAHLAGVYVMELASPALFYGDPTGFADVRLIEEMMQKMREAATAAAGPVEEGFRERLRRDGIEGEWRLVEGRAVRDRGAPCALCRFGRARPTRPEDHGLHQRRDRSRWSRCFPPAGRC